MFQLSGFYWRVSRLKAQGFRFQGLRFRGFRFRADLGFRLELWGLGFNYGV